MSDFKKMSIPDDVDRDAIRDYAESLRNDPEMRRRIADFRAQPGSFVRKLARISIRRHIAEVRAQLAREAGDKPNENARSGFKKMPIPADVDRDAIRDYVDKRLNDPEMRRRIADFRAQPGSFVRKLSRLSIRRHIAKVQAQLAREAGEEPDEAKIAAYIAEREGDLTRL